eukprot:1176105-Prorocentrum_minimum.AAC.3
MGSLLFKARPLNILHAVLDDQKARVEHQDGPHARARVLERGQHRSHHGASDEHSSCHQPAINQLPRHPVIVLRAQLGLPGLPLGDDVLPHQLGAVLQLVLVRLLVLPALLLVTVALGRLRLPVGGERPRLRPLRTPHLHQLRGHDAADGGGEVEGVLPGVVVAVHRRNLLQALRVGQGAPLQPRSAPLVLRCYVRHSRGLHGAQSGVT